MNTLIRILLGAFIGTLLMTFFSYSVSWLFNKQFKEPVLLKKLLQRSEWFTNRPEFAAAGWLLHFGAGTTFVIFYHFIWKHTGIAPDYLSGSLLGAASGIFGMGIWYMIFSLHQNPPSIELSKYFLQLFFAHILFGLGAVAGYLFAASIFH